MKKTIFIFLFLFCITHPVCAEKRDMTETQNYAHRLIGTWERYKVVIGDLPMISPTDFLIRKDSFSITGPKGSSYGTVDLINETTFRITVTNTTAPFPDSVSFPLTTTYTYLVDKKQDTSGKLRKHLTLTESDVREFYWLK